MDPKVIMCLVICVAVISVTGCTTHPSEPAGTTTFQTPLLQATPAATAFLEQGSECTSSADCIPAGCCHPSGCIPGPVKKPCTLMCTASCEGPLDCGAGSCGCVNGKCGVVPATTAMLQQAPECTSSADCVPAECCHPTRCIPGLEKKPCNLLCTQVCEGPLDCGAGSCGCINQKCGVVPASTPLYTPGLYPGITITASPRRYSPMMSSTPGIGLQLITTGFRADNATFAWKATYGHFLSWNPPDYRVSQLGDSVTNHGEKLYWSFIDKPSSPAAPVTITVTATESGSGRLLGNSTVTLAWDGNYAVTVNTPE